MAVKGCIIDRFSTGNFDSLNKPDIRERLLEYYENHYSSNIMSLCLAGNHSLDALQKLAVENFSQIEEKRVPSDKSKVAGKTWGELNNEAMGEDYLQKEWFVSSTLTLNFVFNFLVKPVAARERVTWETNRSSKSAREHGATLRRTDYH